jgi:hypothetical protein
MVVGPLKRAGRVDHYERSIDRSGEPVAVAKLAPAEFGPDSVRKVGPDLRASSSQADPTPRFACKGFGDPAAEDSVAPQNGDDARRLGHSGVTDPSY